MKSLYNPANNNSGAGDEYPVCDQLIIDNINYRASLEQGNIRYGSVLVTKFNDLNGNTVWDEGEEVLPDWEIKLSSVSGESTKITQSNGEASFIDLLPGSYDLSENIESQPGWKQTGIYCGDRMPMTIVEQEPLLTSLFGGREVLAVAWDGGGEPVTVNPGQTTNCYIGNRIEKIALTLDKTHDKMGMTASRGDILNFTLTVANTEEGTAYNVTVQDSLPDGFSYVAGSGKVEGVTFVPTISGNKLIWNVGEIAGESSKTITYQVKISDSMAEGSHANVAVASGYNRPEDGDKVNSNFAFVYTAVGIGVSYSVSVGGAVLGATTTAGEVLGAATGSPTMLLITAILMILAGLTILLLKKGKKLHV